MGIPKLTIKDVPIHGKTVLVRADYNVPLKPDGSISDDFRIRSSLPTLKYLLDRGCKLVIISHLGRPEGKDSKFSLEPVADRLAKLLKKDVLFVSETIGDKPAQVIKHAPKGSIIFLENLRFYKEEEKNSETFAKKIAEASQSSYFVQDGFGVVHRAHASTDAITHYLPSVAGLLLEKEYNALTSVIEAPKKPLTAVIGGAKISDKIGVMEKFIDKADHIIIGGAMANTFLKYRGFNIGASKVEDGMDKVIDKIYLRAKVKAGSEVDDFIILPTDLVVSKKISESSTYRTEKVNSLSKDDIALDLGEETMERALKIIQKSRTVIWNGTLGYAEIPQFSKGSLKLARALANNPKVTSIIGGGDTVDFVLKMNKLADQLYSHISTGGGASIELLSGLKLPGIESLLDAPKKLRYTNKA